MENPRTPLYVRVKEVEKDEPHFEEIEQPVTLEKEPEDSLDTLLHLVKNGLSKIYVQLKEKRNFSQPYNQKVKLRAANRLLAIAMNAIRKFPIFESVEKEKSATEEFIDQEFKKEPEKKLTMLDKIVADLKAEDIIGNNNESV